MDTGEQTDILPFARVNFVRPGLTDKQDDDFEATETSTATLKLLSGSEAREFYESVVQESCLPSSSCSQSHSTDVTTATKKVPSARPTRQKKLIKKQPEKVETIASHQLTERDVNAFLKAAADGDIGTLQKHLENGMNIDVADRFGWTALMCAAYSGHQRAVLFLKSHNANIAWMDRKGRTAWNLAIEQRHFALADCLIANSDLPKKTSKTNEKLPAPVFCPDCKIPYTECSHCTSTVHLLSTKTPRQDPGYGIPESNRGYRMLQQHGWDEYSGLGKDGSGQRYPVKTVLKRDRKGLGIDRPKPKVTHFGPRDTDAVVVDRAQQQVRLKSTTVAKRQIARVEAKSRKWEADYRRQFTMD